MSKKRLLNQPAIFVAVTVVVLAVAVGATAE
jgi:hypothetical protein